MFKTDKKPNEGANGKPTEGPTERPLKGQMVGLLEGPANFKPISANIKKASSFSFTFNSFNSNFFTDINKNIKKKCFSDYFKDNNLDNLEFFLEENPNIILKVKKKIERQYSELNKDSFKIEGIGMEQYDKPETFLKMVYTNAIS